MAHNDGGSGAFPNHERLTLTEEYPENLWPRLVSICGDAGSWNFTLLCDDNIPSLAGTTGPAGQEVLTVPDKCTRPAEVHPPLDIQPLVTSGDSSNRVDLVFFGDGYTAREKDKFLADAERLALDISQNQTFNTVKPLLNFWAAFSPSNESGVGTNGKPKDTLYGLYRDGTELRGVYYSKPEVAHAACSSMGDKCDYPILMGNDPLYGGLGGTFTVITPSLANGALVLRHELGHSMIYVGEEYDGGPGYFGVNAAHSVDEPIPWAHWFTGAPENQHVDHEGKLADVRVERSVMPMQAYPWTMLNASEPWSINFESSGAYSRHLVRFSLSGLPDEEDLLVELDGQDLGWIPRLDIGIDRWHYDVHRNESLNLGEREVKFTLRDSGREGIAQLCSVEVLEFGSEDEFISTPGHYGVYPTFSDKNETSYRPTNEDCLMRIVTTPNFCSVCLEGLWLSLFNRVDPIDGIRTDCVAGNADRNHATGSSANTVAWKRTLDLDLVPLAQFRTDAVSVEESYTITWVKDGEALEEFTNKTHLELDHAVALGTYMVDVQFTTAEVRVDREGLLRSSAEYQVTGSCGL
ncbi:hypothetical protein WOLCODRAFT_150474 [Wolfiporia cocos MD-104 SS10]|uniref:IgA peptidase M64 n=1 Tax=Wolfiporia cocos (strain MD-104) TaxID=742152 RepID=A0A2H3JRN5_WOLCO|nr:hypothetical protein WOLCODRAFT_150474 [Wolfiporia cocos MD-104 SS10]